MNDLSTEKMVEERLAIINKRNKLELAFMKLLKMRPQQGHPFQPPNW
jgi:hypothetical protein